MRNTASATKNRRKKDAYLITICTENRACLFGNIVTDRMILNSAGRIVKNCWHAIQENFANTSLDEFIIMPNHIHGIIIINRTPSETKKPPSLQSSSNLGKKCPTEISKTVNLIIQDFQIGVSNLIHHSLSLQEVWQNNYLSYCIQNEKEMRIIRQYIRENPKNWEIDKHNTKSEYNNFNMNTFDTPSPVPDNPMRHKHRDLTLVDFAELLRHH